MSLRTYAKKRDFAVTTEPRATRARAGDKPIFVVQLHHARARHYDFRLQVGDALKSWAVPKGPSYNPTVKRLAVEVEDHPLAYADFSGEIPAGQYGGGHVDLFDHGTWSTQTDARMQLRKGHLAFQLNGRRLRGAWHLVRTRRKSKQPQWVLFKSKDEFASDIDADDLIQQAGSTIYPQASTHSAAQSARRSTVRATVQPWHTRALAIEGAVVGGMKEGAFAPQLARSRAAAPAGDGWMHETKWDGYRILATVAHRTSRLWSRNALEWTRKLPTIVAALNALALREARFDGELIANTPAGASFNALQAALAGEGKTDLIYAIFDLVHIDGVSLANCPLVERKNLLQAVLQTSTSDNLLFSDHHIGDGARVQAAAAKRGLEGIVSKRVESRYRAGRGDDWVKVKNVLSDEFAIVGFTHGRGSRVGIGALLLGRADKRGKWEYAGRVGSGFSNAVLRKIHKLLTGIQRDTAPVRRRSLVNRDVGEPIWVVPKYVVEAYYRGIGKEGLLRQASLKALREDKSAQDLQREPDESIKAIDVTAKKRSVKTTARTKRGSRSRRADVDLSYLSHPDRIVFPDGRYTKRRVAEYYEHVMQWFLPQIADRPLSIVRCPNGATKKCFFQKHHSPQLGKHVRTLPLKDSRGAKINFLYVEDADGVRDLVQMNALEFHPWGTTVDRLETADQLVFDLDPGTDVAWKDVVDAALLLRQLLTDMKLASFVRLSGGKGLHVVAPLSPPQPWNTAKSFSRQVAAALAQERPKDFIDVATKAKRRGRIFVDYLRNARGATSVAAYSLRARPGAPVAMPIDWRNLNRIARPNAFSLDRASADLTKRKVDPWENIDALRQSIDTRSK